MTIAHLTEKEVAARLRVTTRTLRKWREEERGIPCMGIGADGKTYRYRLADVEEYEAGKMIGQRVPAGAVKSMLRAAQVLEVIMRWPLREEQRSLLESVRNDLRVHINQNKEA